MALRNALPSFVLPRLAGPLLAPLLAAFWAPPAHAQAPAGHAPAPVQAPAAPAGGSMVEKWNQPFAPFRVLGNIYYVGAAGVSSFLIKTPAGSILLDGGLAQTAPLIQKGIAELGFRLKDVKYLLNSHSHYDHAGGLAALKKASGAKLVASEGDAATLRAGSPEQPAVAVDRVLNDGDTLELGGSVLTAHVTPGHTPGCTTWTMTATDAGKPYQVVFYCSTSVVDRLVDNPGYPSIVADYERSFPLLRALPCDVFLGPHGEFFQLAQKRERMTPGAANPFIDPGELRRFVDRSEQQFREALAQEQAAASPPVKQPVKQPPVTQPKKSPPRGQHEH
jgi:metallo-beta-lactamase class B